MSAHRFTADPYILIWNTHLHLDGFLLGVLFLWTILGTAIYLFSRGLKEGPKPGLTVFCGPSAWILGFYKMVRVRYIRKDIPPPVPKTWDMPKAWERG